MLRSDLLVCYIKKPRYCPQCGESLTDYPEEDKNKNAIWSCVDTHGVSGPKRHFISDTPHITWKFDCYCAKCGWSGMISPDVHDTEIEEEVRRNKNV